MTGVERLNAYKEYIAMLKWISIPSSNLYAIEYVDASRILKVEFQSGSVYEYYNVEPEIYEKLLSVFPYKSKDGQSNYSLGSWFYFNVRDKYQYKQI